MLIGLHDMDMSTYTYVPFNLEIMKLSAYYKRKRHLVALSRGYFPNDFSEFFLRKDYDDGMFPENFSTQKNLKYGGHAFSGKTYYPLPVEIEKILPDNFIYEKFRKDYLKKPWQKTTFNAMMGASHLRISLDGANPFNGFEKQVNIHEKSKILMLHDRDLTQIKDAKDVVKEVFSIMRDNRLTRRLALKFPLRVSSEEELLGWTKFKVVQDLFPIEYTGVMEDEFFAKYVLAQKGFVFSSQLNYLVAAPPFDQNDFIVRILPKIFKQVIFSCMNRVPISLKYTDGFFVDKRWERVLELISMYTRQMARKPVYRLERGYGFDSLYSFVASFDEELKYSRRPFLKAEVRDLFSMVRKENYELFKMFYETSVVELKGGNFEDVTTRNKRKDYS